MGKDYFAPGSQLDHKVLHTRDGHIDLVTSLIIDWSCRPQVLQKAWHIDANSHQRSSFFLLLAFPSFHRTKSAEFGPCSCAPRSDSAARAPPASAACAPLLCAVPPPARARSHTPPVSAHLGLHACVRHLPIRAAPLAQREGGGEEE